MNTKILSLAVAMGVGLVGCDKAPTHNTQKDSTATSTVSSTSKTDTFTSKLPDSAPTVKVGTTGTMPPFSLQDNYGNMSGYDIDVARAIGEVEGFKVQFVKQPWDNLFNAVQSGDANMAMSGISYKPERAEKYNLSNSYFYNPSAIMYKNPQLNIKSLQDLKGLRVGGMKDTKQLDTIRGANIAGSIVETDTTFLLYQALINDKVDAIVQDYPLLKDTANRHPEYKVTIIPYENRQNPQAQQVIVIAKGNDKLLSQVNDGITKIKENGTMKKIEDKWKISVEDVDNSSMSSTSSISSPNATKK